MRSTAKILLRCKCTHTHTHTHTHTGSQSAEEKEIIMLTDRQLTAIAESDFQEYV